MTSFWIIIPSQRGYRRSFIKNRKNKHDLGILYLDFILDYRFRSIIR